MTFLVTTTPLPSAAGSTDTVFAFARPENFQAFFPVRFPGSVVNCAPILPMPLRPDCFRSFRKHDSVRTIPQTSSWLQLAGKAVAMVSQRATFLSSLLCQRNRRGKHNFVGPNSFPATPTTYMYPFFANMCSIAAASSKV